MNSVWVEVTITCDTFTSIFTTEKRTASFWVSLKMLNPPSKELYISGIPNVPFRVPPLVHIEYRQDKGDYLCIAQPYKCRDLDQWHEYVSTVETKWANSNPQ